MMAVKVYNLPQLGELNKVQLIREIRLHGSFAHRNIIELYVAFQVGSLSKRGFTQTSTTAVASDGVRRRL
jgi:hypothetical protein